MSEPLISTVVWAWEEALAAEFNSALEISMVSNLCEFRERKTQGAFLSLLVEAHQDFERQAMGR
jgi:hypothetical protein